MSIYTHRTKTSSPEGEVICPDGSPLLQLSVLQGKKNWGSFSFFQWKIFTIISFVYVTYVIEETFIGFPSPPGDLFISKLEPQLKFNRRARKKKKMFFFTYIFFRNGEMKTVKWYFSKKNIKKIGQTNSHLVFSSWRWLLRDKIVIVFIFKEKYTLIFFLIFFGVRYKILKY